MELSDEWKSQFPIRTSFKPPLLLSSSSLGPLCFNPKPNAPPEPLFSSPSLFPPILNPTPQLSLSRFLSTSSLPLSTAHSIAALFGASSYHHDPAATSFLFHNRLQLLHCPDQNITLVFFSTGSNHDQVGFLVLQVKEDKLEVVCNENNDVFVAKYRFNQKILRILVNPVGELDDCLGNSTHAVVGYLMACTMYSVHWFCIKIAESSKRPVVDYLGFKLFKTSSIAGACWSPHMPQESVVLLEDGSLFLFDLETYFRSQKPNACFKGSRLRVLWDDSVSLENHKWLGCEFSWHPRVLLVAGTKAVFSVDLRLDESNITCLANIEMLRLYAPVEKEQFIAFSGARSSGFQFVLASNSLLILCDVRKPLMPLLYWAHDLGRPCYIDVFKLSELRSKACSEAHEWATKSGFCILLGSFWDCEFRLFCYGPSLPACEESIASGNSKPCKPFFAWELPSDLFLSVRECCCGSCLVREEFAKDALPGWIDWRQKKEIVLGFGILNQDLSNLLSKSDEFGGFTLIRLMSSGKLEGQRYSASWELVKKLHESHKESLLNFESSLLHFIEDEEYKFSRRFKYLKLEYLKGYLNGSLAEVLDSKMRMSSKGPLEKEYSLDFHEILCEKLKVCGFGRFRSSPAIAAVFNEISLPTSVIEVALRQMWASLPMELLQLAFCSYSECFDVLLDQKNVSLDFAVVPNPPQLPPFFLRKASCHSSKGSNRVQLSDSLVGPVLPLPILLTLHEFQMGCPDSEEVCAYSSKVELGLRCNEVIQVATEMAVSDSGSEFHSNRDVSLADDRDEMWVDSQKSKPFFIYHPIANETSAIGDTQKNHKDEDFDTLISQVCLKEANPGEHADTVGAGLELFDDLCPIKLNFDVHGTSFGSQQLEACNLLKNWFSMWQKSYRPYQELCTRTKIGKKDAEF
ncbi:hypothetical protein SLA2020_104810 [Shorea laevis]